MTGREKFKKDGAVYWKVSAHPNRPQCSEDADGCEVRTAGSDHTEYCCDSDGEIESPSSPEDVASEAPEDSPEE